MTSVVDDGMKDVKVDDKKANCDYCSVRRSVPRVSGIYAKGQVEELDIIYAIT